VGFVFDIRNLPERKYLAYGFYDNIIHQNQPLAFLLSFSVKKSIAPPKPKQKVKKKGTL
jgi:hypothetical protein